MRRQARGGGAFGGHGLEVVAGVEGAVGIMDENVIQGEDRHASRLRPTVLEAILN